MNTNDNSDVSLETLATLRRESDAVRIIAERLKVKEMGPADHIRTKHEIKAFVESGEVSAAEQLLKRARERRELSQSATMKISRQQTRTMNE